MKVFVIGSVPVGKDDTHYSDGQTQLSIAAGRLGLALVEHGHQLVVCSPFEDSADFHVVKGASQLASVERRPKVEFYYPATANVTASLDSLSMRFANLEIQRVRQFPPMDEKSGEAWKHAWLLAQLRAVEESSAVVAIAGKTDGPMSFLLPFAEMKKKPILPFAFLGGAAGQWFDSNHRDLGNLLGDRSFRLSDPAAVADVADLLDLLTSVGAPKTKSPLTFFISYAKARPAEADFIEMLLQRNKRIVFRDDRHFGAGSMVESEITRLIDRSDIFIAVWCREYACSPWCFDELNYALDRQDEKRTRVWIVPVDETRIVPPRARTLLTFEMNKSREGLGGRLMKEIEKLSEA